MKNFFFIVKTYQYIILMNRDDFLGVLSLFEEDYKIFWIVELYVDGLCFLLKLRNYDILVYNSNAQ